MIHCNPREINGYKFQERQRDAFEEHKAIKFYYGKYGEENVKILAMVNQYNQPYTDIYVKVEALRRPKRKLVAQFGSAMEFEGPGGERVGDTIRVHEGPGGRKSMHITQRNPRRGHPTPFVLAMAMQEQRTMGRRTCYEWRKKFERYARTKGGINWYYNEITADDRRVVDKLLSETHEVRRNPRSGHTPGPWEVSKHGTPSYAPQFGIYAEGEQNDLAIVRGENAEADAILISAAPELLELLL